MSIFRFFKIMLLEKQGRQSSLRCSPPLADAGQLGRFARGFCLTSFICVRTDTWCFDICIMPIVPLLNRAMSAATAPQWVHAVGGRQVCGECGRRPGRTLQ